MHHFIGKVEVKNAVLNAERINQDLVDNNIPFLLKHGMIGNLNVSVSYCIFD